MAQKIELGTYEKMESELNAMCNYYSDSIKIGKRFRFSFMTTFAFLFHKVSMYLSNSYVQVI